MKSIVVAVAVLVVTLPASASVHVAEPTLTVVDVPLGGARVLTASATPDRFDLVGLHWQGTGAVQFRTHRSEGGWSGWRAAAPEAEDRPDADSLEARAAARWHVGSPWWVGASDRITYRLRGQVNRLRAFFVRSPTGERATRTLATATSPPIVSRSGWNADETLRSSSPRYADALRFAVVHHTAGANDYTREDAPAVVRAIELYHVKGNGWNDLGYNFLVDRFGTVYEGRYGGADQNVIGAHALGFNTSSVGVAMIGTYTDAAPPPAAADALTRLLAWRLDIGHVDPHSTLSVISGGSERYAPGKSVQLRAISGHRDTGATACPGDAFYAQLDALANKVRGIGLPKIFAPLVSGQVGGPVRIQAALSGSRPWSVRIVDAAGDEVAAGSGEGPVVDWTWDAATAAPGGYTWEIAVAGATPATGSLRAASSGSPTLALTGTVVDPETISPNGDGVADVATLTYTTTAPATVNVTVVDGNGAVVATLVNAAYQSAGAHAVAFAAGDLVDGRYTIRIDATDVRRTVSATVEVLVTRTLGDVTVSPQTFSPNGDGHADRLAVRFTLRAGAAVRVRVLRDGAWVATAFSGAVAAGRRVVYWDGAKRRGRLLDGAYTSVVEATDATGTSSLVLSFASDTRPPAVRILPGKTLRVWVSEPARLAVRVSGHAIAMTAPGGRAIRVPWQGLAGRVRVVAWDKAGNVSRPATRS